MHGGKVVLGVALLGAALACARSDPPPPGASLVGEMPARDVVLVEHHSEALPAWRRAGVRDRIALHLDGHADFDWLPDTAIARFAGETPGGLAALAHHPLALDGETHRRYGIWNFLYPAARLGLVREIVWVVPDGTFAHRADPERLVRELLFAKVHGMTLEEAGAWTFEERRARGRAIGVPILVTELADLPRIDEPVLLDIDLDYFTTASATTQEVVPVPWTTPTEVVAALRAKGIRTDLATVSYSTYGGYTPPEARWLGRAMVRGLTEPGRPRDADASRRAVGLALASGRYGEAVRLATEAVRRDPGDASASYALALAHAGAGDSTAATRARAAAVAADRVFAEADLFEADALWLSGRVAEAEPRFREYAATRPEPRFAVYALRRLASCQSRLGRPAEAERTLRAVLARAPNHADSRLDLALLLRRSSRLDEAVEELRRALAILPDLGTYSMALGTTLVLEGRVAEGVASLRRAAATRPSWAAPRARLAAVLAASGRISEAREHLRSALLLDPRDPVARGLARSLRSGRGDGTGASATR